MDEVVQLCRLGSWDGAGEKYLTLSFEEQEQVKRVLDSWHWMHLEAAADKARWRQVRSAK
jgi:hypothetical protein